MKEQLDTKKEPASWQGLRNIVITGPGYVRYLTPEYEVTIRNGEPSCSHRDCLTQDGYGREKPEYNFSESIRHWLAAICAPTLSPGTNLIDIGKKGETARCTVEVNAPCPIPNLDEILTARKEVYTRGERRS